MFGALVGIRRFAAAPRRLAALAIFFVTRPRAASLEVAFGTLEAKARLAPAVLRRASPHHLAKFNSRAFACC